MKNKEQNIPLFSSLVFRSTAAVLLVSVAIMTIGAHLVTSNLYRLSLENLSRETRQAAKFASLTLARPMWDFNEAAGEEILASLSKNEVFCGSRLAGDDGKAFAESGFPAGGLSADQLLISEQVMFDDPTDDIEAQKSIGTLEVCATMAPLKAQIDSIFNSIIATSAAVSLAVVLAVLLSQQILMRPMRRFKTAMQSFQNTMEPITDAELTQRNEIGDLVRSFNSMANSLSETYRDLKKAKDEAEEAYRVKTDFFANMSHELRTPLNSVIGMAQLIEGTAMDNEQREMFDSIRRSSENLLKIVNDILDISKIEAHQVQLERTPFDAYRELRHTVQAILPIASRKGLTLSFEATEASLPVFGDPLRFTRIITNLISNAVSYTEEGSVAVYARPLLSPEGRVNLTVEVVDTGIGIPADKINSIFEKFTQADTSTTRKYGGTGLGLTITKELIELMGGRIFVTSAPGKGSVFSFTVPLDVAKPEDLRIKGPRDEFSDVAPAGISGLPASQARILIVEDHVMNQMFMKKLFKNLGVAHYTIAQNGREALDELKVACYDLILMDCHMPEMNGYDATVAIRNLDDPILRAIPIVAMTANAMPEDEHRCLDCGMNAYLSKPLDIKIFKKKLSPWISFEPENTDKKPFDASAEMPPINLENLKSNSMGDEEFEREMIAMFVTQGHAQIEALSLLCVDGDSEDWTETAHALKGTAGSVGSEKMRVQCAMAQDMFTATAEERKKRLAQITHEYARSKAFLIAQGLYTPENG